MNTTNTIRTDITNSFFLSFVHILYLRNGCEFQFEFVDLLLLLLFLHSFKRCFFFFSFAQLFFFLFTAFFALFFLDIGFDFLLWLFRRRRHRCRFLFAMSRLSLCFFSRVFGSFFFSLMNFSHTQNWCDCMILKWQTDCCYTICCYFFLGSLFLSMHAFHWNAAFLPHFCRMLFSFSTTVRNYKFRSSEPNLLAFHYYYNEIWASVRCGVPYYCHQSGFCRNIFGSVRFESRTTTTATKNRQAINEMKESLRISLNIDLSKFRSENTQFSIISIEIYRCVSNIYSERSGKKIDKIWNIK